MLGFFMGCMPAMGLPALGDVSWGSRIARWQRYCEGRGAYGRLFIAAARLRSVWLPLVMAPFRIMYWAPFMGLVAIMRRWSRCWFWIWPRFCVSVSTPPCLAVRCYLPGCGRDIERHSWGRRRRLEQRRRCPRTGPTSRAGTSCRRPGPGA